ncbi:MAG TPA: ribosome maturation factor RimP [Pseudonocardiaceae bacterium]
MPSPSRGELAAQLEPVVLDAVRGVGFDLELLEVQQSGRRRLVRVVVDSDDGVGLDQVAEASRAVSAALDTREDLLPGPYTLEVTSRGVDRPLTQPRHWRRARFRLVRVQLVDGGQLLGRVGDSDDEGVVLLVEGQLRRVAYADVRRAVVEVEFRQPPAEELAALERGGAVPDDSTDRETDSRNSTATSAGVEPDGNEEEPR